jgi:hypothetical protein
MTGRDLPRSSEMVRARARPGLPGVGWVLAAFYVFAAIMFTTWAVQDSRQNTPRTAAPAATQDRATTGSATNH